MSAVTATRPAPSSRRAARTRLDPFPRDPLRRWSLRLALAVPYLVVAALGAATGGVTAVDSPNQQLLDRLATIPWDRADPEWIGQIFPPLGTVLGLVIPGGRVGLSVAGALLAGIFLQRLVEIMVQRRFPLSTTIILIVALGANPLFAYTATENFTGFLGLAFFGLAISDVVRFIAWRNTRAGFRAGMLLMLATLSSPSGLVYVLAAALAAPFLRLARGDQKGARASNVLVIVYPTVSALAGIVFLAWVFTGDPLTAFGGAILDGAPERLATLTSFVFSASGLAMALPVLSVWLIALVVRQPGSIVVSTLVYLAVLASYVIGLLPSGSSGTTFILMLVMAMALIPTARERGTAVLVDLIGIGQIAIAWWDGTQRETITDWMMALVQGLGL